MANARKDKPTDSADPPKAIDPKATPADDLAKSFTLAPTPTPALSPVLTAKKNLLLDTTSPLLVSHLFPFLSANDLYRISILQKANNISALADTKIRDIQTKLDLDAKDELEEKMTDAINNGDEILALLCFNKLVRYYKSQNLEDNYFKDAPLVPEESRKLGKIAEYLINASRLGMIRLANDIYHQCEYRGINLRCKFHRSSDNKTLFQKDPPIDRAMREAISHLHVDIVRLFAPNLQNSIQPKRKLVIPSDWFLADKLNTALEKSNDSEEIKRLKAAKIIYFLLVNQCITSIIFLADGHSRQQVGLARFIADNFLRTQSLITEDVTKKIVNLLCTPTLREFIKGFYNHLSKLDTTDFLRRPRDNIDLRNNLINSLQRMSAAIPKSNPSEIANVDTLQFEQLLLEQINTYREALQKAHNGYYLKALNTYLQLEKDQAYDSSCLRKKISPLISIYNILMPVLDEMIARHQHAEHKHSLSRKS